MTLQSQTLDITLSYMTFCPLNIWHNNTRLNYIAYISITQREVLLVSVNNNARLKLTDCITIFSQSELKVWESQVCYFHSIGFRSPLVRPTRWISFTMTKQFITSCFSTLPLFNTSSNIWKNTQNSIAYLISLEKKEGCSENKNP